MIRRIIRSIFYLAFYTPVRAWVMITRRSVEGRYYRDRYYRLLRRLGFRFSHSIGSRRFIYDPSVSAMGHRLCFEGELELMELKSLRPYVRADRIILNVGANIGLYSVYLSGLAPQGKIYAFEPSKETLALLLQNIHDLPSVIPVCMGLSNVSGEAEFHVASDNALSGLKDPGRFPFVSIERILTVTGDDFVRILTLPRVDIVHIGVEGMEREVIQGMRDTLSRHHPVLLCEVYQGIASNPDPVQTIRESKAFGYEAFVARSSGPVRFAGTHSDDESNYLFRPITYS